MNWLNICAIIVGVVGLVLLVQGIPSKRVPLIALGAALLAVAVMALTNWIGE